VPGNTTGRFFRSIANLFGSATFRKTFILVLIAEAITICGARLLLGVNIDRWIHDKAMQAVRISQSAASSTDWMTADKIPIDRDSALFQQYLKKVNYLSNQQFKGAQDGEVFLVVIHRGKAYEINADEPPPMAHNGKANPAELGAYQTRKTAYTPFPLSDQDGTYLAAYTPVLRNGAVVGLVAAEFDTATLADMREIVRRAFWLSILPAFLLSLLMAAILTSMFVEPMEIFRRLDETTASHGVAGSPGRVAEDPLSQLSPREREIAELVRRGQKNREIADALTVSPETVKQHLKNIREKTGFTRVDLAVQAEAQRILSIRDASPAI
jgi:DNA-binding CsgD family transcriptional regulator